MATCVPFQSQLSSIMEVLVRAAVAEISKLVDDKCAFLHLEISRKQSENEMLRKKLRIMENKNAQLQQGFENYLDRGIALENNCTPAAGDMKFPDLHDNTVPFTIKEENPDESLWISDSAQTVGSAVQYTNTASSETRPFEKNCQLDQTEVNRQKTMDFSNNYNSSHHNSAMSHHFTVKTEKEEGQSGFGQDECQHSATKQTQSQSNNNSVFSIDERENQLWSSIMEGNEIESGFPDFSSVVDEYSNTFPELSEAEVVAKSNNVQQPQSQRPCNGIYNSEYPKDVSHFQQTLSNNSHNTHLEEQTQRQTGERPIGSQSGSINYNSQHGFHKTVSGSARGFVCMQCGKTFGRLHQFKLHQQSHKRKRAFWCGVCGKSFQCSSHLSIHHRTHTGEKPFGCPQCGKRFTQQSSLRVHQRTHSGERPYSCAQCGKTFILMHHLKRHRIIHTYS